MKQRPWMTYAAPFVLVPMALLIVLGIPALREATSLLPFLAAVACVAWLGGLWPSVIAAVLSAVLWSLFVVEPRLSFAIDANNLTRLLFFAVIAIFVSSLYSSRKQAELHARDSERRLELALEAGHMGVWDYDLSSGRFWISSELASLLGIERADFTPTYGGFLAFVHPLDRDDVVRAMTTAIEGKTEYQLAHRVVLRDKAIRNVTTRGRTFTNSRGIAERMIGVVVDAAERTIREDRLLEPVSPYDRSQ